MSALRLDVAGFTVPVLRPKPTNTEGKYGVATAAVMGEDGQPRLVLSIVHPDGAILSAFLDEEAIDRLADMMGAFIEALPDIRSAVRQ